MFESFFLEIYKLCWRNGFYLNYIDIYFVIYNLLVNFDGRNDSNEFLMDNCALMIVIFPLNLEAQN